MMRWPWRMGEPERVVLADVVPAASEYVAERLGAAAGSRGVASLVLAGGGTPLGLYRRLAAGATQAIVPWERVHVFWGDERLVPPDDPGSNYGAAFRALLSRVPLPESHIHRIRGELPPEAAAADYARRLRRWAAAHDPGARHPWPRFDVVLLGLGADGHTASLFPGSPVEADAPLVTGSPVIAVTAEYQGRPAGRATLTPGVFNDARHVVFLVTGSDKAQAVRHAFHEEDPALFPARRIRPVAGQVIWFLDQPAAADLDAR